jgi:ketosteroid isomerase-like protein
MTNAIRSAMLIAACIVCAGRPLPAGADDEQQIRQQEQELTRAAVEGDVAAFERLFAEDLTHGSQSGRFRTKAQWMQGKTQGRSEYVSFDTEDLQVRVLGETAVATGLSTARWREAGRVAGGQFRFLRVWARRDGQWRVIAFQSTAAPAEKPAAAAPTPEQALDLDDPPATREFSIRGDRPYLGGQEIDIWGLRCGNALYSQGVAERHVRNLDNMVAHGINCIGVYVQGSNGGHPHPAAGRNGYTPAGVLKPDFARGL